MAKDRSSPPELPAAIVAKEEELKHSLSERLAKALAIPWILGGLTTYTILTLLARQLVHNPKAEALILVMVPQQLYDRSTFIFLTALALDLLNAFFERSTVKLDFVLLPAFIKFMASSTNILVRFGKPVLAISPGGRLVNMQRYICWMHTTPTILVLLKLMSKTITVRETVIAIIWDEIMVVTGAIALVTTGWHAVFWSFITHVTLLPIMPFMHKAFMEAISELKTNSLKNTMATIYAFNVMLWISFGVTWDLALFDLVSTAVEEALYLSCDFGAKVLFSSTLMLSSFKGFEQRREDTMRHIELSSKQKLIEELKHLLEQKERFMSSVSHELRTPLNGIIGISEGMLSGCCGVLPEQVRRQIYIIRTSGARLLALINDVMDAAALRQNKLVLKQEQVVLRHVVDDVLDLTRSLVDSEVELRNTVPPRILVLGDTGRIVQILNNLLGNAAKFTRRGYIKVSARPTDGGKKVAVTVTDTGIGIPKNKLASIFLPFEQVDMSISRKYGGFGLGLNIVQELVKAHGGDIWVESQEAKGSAFTFLLPLVREARRGEFIEEPYEQSILGGAPASNQDMSSELLEARPRGRGNDRDRDRAHMEHELGEDPLLQYGELTYNAAELSALGSSKPFVTEDSRTLNSLLPAAVNGGSGSNQHADSNSGEPPLRPLHHQKYGRYLLLSVDDDMVNQNVVLSLLSSTGYEVAQVPSGPEALAFLERCDALPDLILLDCMMPEMDGYEALARIRAMLPHTHLPVIMVSAQAEEEHVVQGLDQGADDYITKPFKRNEFLARIKTQLGFVDDDDDAEAKPLTDSAESNLYKERIILCVDDDEVNQMILQGMLRSQLYKYIKAKTGEEGLSFLTPGQQPPDLVLLDCSLPDVSGFDVCKRIRTMFTKQQVPVIMLSARHNETAIVEGLQCGANDYVTKPFRRGELLARIRMHLRIRTAPSPAEPVSSETRLHRSPSLDFIIASKVGPDQSSSDRMGLHDSVAMGNGGGAHAANGMANANGMITTMGNGGNVTERRGWRDAAVLAAEVVDPLQLLAGIPAADVAAVQARLAGVFDQLVAQHGLVRAKMPMEGGGKHEVHCALITPQDESLHGVGQALLRLQRAGRALLDAASWLVIPHSSNSHLLLHVALHVGPVTQSYETGRLPSYSGEAMTGAAKLLHWAPPMTVVCGDLVAYQLRDSGATGIRELPSAVMIGAGQGVDRRVWLVEAHPLSRLQLPNESVPFVRPYDETERSSTHAPAWPGGGGGGNSLTAGLNAHMDPLRYQSMDAPSAASMMLHAQQQQQPMHTQHGGNNPYFTAGTVGTGGPAGMLSPSQTMMQQQQQAMYRSLTLGGPSSGHAGGMDGFSITGYGTPPGGLPSGSYAVRGGGHNVGMGTEELQQNYFPILGMHPQQQAGGGGGAGWNSGTQHWGPTGSGGKTPAGGGNYHPHSPPSSTALAGVLKGGMPGGMGGAGLPDPAVMAAEAELNALRNELGVMRQQMDVISAAGRTNGVSSAGGLHGTAAHAHGVSHAGAAGGDGGGPANSKSVRVPVQAPVDADGSIKKSKTTGLGRLFSRSTKSKNL